MPLSVRCSCGKDVAFEEEDRGTEVFCFSCGRACSVPEAEAEPVAVTAPPAPPQEPPFDPALEERVRWLYPQRPQASDRAIPLRGAPAVTAEGTILAGLPGELVTLDASGTTLWSYPLDGHVPGSVVLGPDGRVRVHATDGMLHCVDPEGRRVWPPVEVGPPLGWAAPLVDEAGSTWICSASGGLARVESDGNRRPRGSYFLSSERLDSTGLIHQGVLYVGTDFDGRILAIQLGGERGVELWNPSEGLGRTGWSINGALALDSNGPALVVPCHDDHLHAFGLDGRSVWKVLMPGQLRASPVLDPSGRVYIGVSQASIRGGESGALVCLDPVSGQIRFRAEARGPVESTPVIGDDGTVYFGDNAGWVHAVSLHGQVLWSQRVGAPVRSAGTIVEPGLLLFGLDDGRLIALDCPSARLAAEGWPKLLGNLSQSGLASGAQAESTRASEAGQVSVATPPTDPSPPDSVNPE